MMTQERSLPATTGRPTVDPDGHDPVSPLSGSRNVTRLARLSAHELIADWKRQLGIDIAAEFGDVEAVDVFRCNDSGLTFFAPRGLAASERVYAALHRIPWYYDTNKWEHALVRDRFRPGESVLDVGCGDGVFVAMAQEAGIDVRGTDTCAEAIEAGREKGRAVEVGDIGELAAARPESFDGVCSFQVLEHVPDPLAFIDACVRATRRGGKVVFAVPNALGYLKHCHDVLDLPPHHMSRWRASSFQYLQRLFPITLSELAYQPLTPNQRAAFVQAVKARWRSKRLGGMFGRERVIRLWSHVLTTLAPSTLRGHSFCAVFIKQ